MLQFQDAFVFGLSARFFLSYIHIFKAVWGGCFTLVFEKSLQFLERLFFSQALFVFLDQRMGQ